jgi:malate dehydrogenase (oxaloacetate-decarboxylating)(NADP+)
MIAELGLRMVPGEDMELIDPDNNAFFDDYWPVYHERMQDHGVSPDEAQLMTRRTNTVMAALMLAQGDADAMICGTAGRYHNHLRHLEQVIGHGDGVDKLSSLNVLILPQGQMIFLCDTQVNAHPTPQEIANMTLLAADQVRRFGNTPKVALLSHSNYGSADTRSARKMRKALKLINEAAPDLAVDGEMHGDAALNETIRKRLYPNSRFDGVANLLIMPNLDAANITYNVVKTACGATSIGPILLGAAKPAHILTTSVTSRGIVNISALAVVDAQG